MILIYSYLIYSKYLLNNYIPLYTKSDVYQCPNSQADYD